MKFSLKTLTYAIGFATVAGIIAGCATPTIPIEMEKAGEIKLPNVSKIALANFNTLEGDAFTGTKAADAETCALVKRAVAAAFYSLPTYEIVDMEVEAAINKVQQSLAKKRFDAVVYGRLWWQVSPEMEGVYPKKYTLTQWDNVPYVVENFLTKEKVTKIAKVKTLSRDVLVKNNYRSSNATLMLTLSVYSLDSDGALTKIVDTYQVSNEGFTLLNGEMVYDYASVGIKDDGALERLKEASTVDEKKTAYETVTEGEPQFSIGMENAMGLASGLGLSLGAFGDVVDVATEAIEEISKTPESKDAQGRRVDPVTGKFLVSKNEVALPTELEAKLLLGVEVANNLSSKITPTKQVLEVPANLGDATLVNLLRYGAFDSAKEYSLYQIRQRLGKEICDKLKGFVPDLESAYDYGVPETGEEYDAIEWERIAELLDGDSNVNIYTLSPILGRKDEEVALALEKSAQTADAVISLVNDEELEGYFYALGLCNEAMRKYDEANECYRFAFNVKPNLDAALGIARIALAQGEANRVKKTRKATREASKKAKLD